jgi:hypothetical protein
LRDPTKDGAFLRTMAPGTVATLASGRGNYKSLTMDSAARQVAFLSGHWSAYENAPEVNRLLL